ncbi:MAG: hypothetical protein M1337_08210 [Actinobacteria bacterium]|nr:hypothetical protein [Actinomycetota bacterium]MCL5026466.1 hypothetical protein [Chloroflexota bacterium]
MTSEAIGTAVARGQYRAAGFWRFDTKAIVGGVFFGIVMVLLVGVSDKADATLSGGTFLIFGGITWATVMGISTLLCRQPAGVIAGLMEGIVAILTGASPMAPTFPVVNAVGSLVYSLAAWKLPMRSWGHHLLAQIAANLVGNALVSVGLFYILDLPVSVILVSSGITALASIIGGTVLTKLIADTVNKSGVLD